MADERQHRQHRLHEQAVLPRAALTQCEVAGIPLGRMKGGITQDNHPSVKWSNQPLKGVIRDIGGGTLPPHDQPPLIEQQTEFAALVQFDGNMFSLSNESFMPFACGKFRPPTAAFRSLPKRQRGLLGS